MSKILVIDDDRSMCETLDLYLAEEGYEVITASTGTEGLNRFVEHSPDVVILDIRLPDMSGYELLMKLRTLTDYVPLVLMTGFGYDRDHTIVKARREGLKFVLYKPFRLDQLVSAIEHTIEERQQQVSTEATLAVDD